jgi:hypothetical protein
MSSNSIRALAVATWVAFSEAAAPRGRRCFAYDLFGPKVIVSRQEPSDAALASRALFVAIRPSNRDLRPLDEASLTKIADQLRPRLFAFRLSNYSQAGSSELAANGLSPRMKDIARALAIPLLADSELESGVIEMLPPRMRRRRSSEEVTPSGW